MLVQTETSAHDEYYTQSPLNVPRLRKAKNPLEYARTFEKHHIAPYGRGGSGKTNCHSAAIQQLELEAKYKAHLTGCSSRTMDKSKFTILDACCGQGILSIYLASLGYNVTGVDISGTALRSAETLAQSAGVERYKFIRADLADIPIPNESIDFVIGSNALHHFIKYPGIPVELKRVLQPGGKCFFNDAFGENFAYRLFHNKKLMEQLGDVVLTKKKIVDYFNGWDIELKPVDWFCMVDKLIARVFPPGFDGLTRRIARMNYWLDRRIPINRATLALAGTVVTVAHKQGATAG